MVIDSRPLPGIAACAQTAISLQEELFLFDGFPAGGPEDPVQGRPRFKV